MARGTLSKAFEASQATMATELCFVARLFIAVSLIRVMASEVDRAGIPQNRLGGSILLIFI